MHLLQKDEESVNVGDYVLELCTLANITFFTKKQVVGVNDTCTELYDGYGITKVKNTELNTIRVTDETLKMVDAYRANVSDMLLKLLEGPLPCNVVRTINRMLSLNMTDIRKELHMRSMYYSKRPETNEKLSVVTSPLSCLCR